MQHGFLGPDPSTEPDVYESVELIGILREDEHGRMTIEEAGYFRMMLTPTGMMVSIAPVDPSQPGDVITADRPVTIGEIAKRMRRSPSTILRRLFGQAARPEHHPEPRLRLVGTR